MSGIDIPTFSSLPVKKKLDSQPLTSNVKKNLRRYSLGCLQGGGTGKPVVNRVITSINRVFAPVTHLFSAIYRGPITPFIPFITDITGSGAGTFFGDFDQLLQGHLMRVRRFCFKDENIYLKIYHENSPNVGRYTID